MKELKQLSQILNNIDETTEIKDIFSQVYEFEEYVEEMKIITSKRQLILKREDYLPHLVSYNQ